MKRLESIVKEFEEKTKIERGKLKTIERFECMLSSQAQALIHAGEMSKLRPLIENIVNDMARRTSLAYVDLTDKEKEKYRPHVYSILQHTEYVLKHTMQPVIEMLKLKD